MPTKRRILLLMSGSIACAKATGLISSWVRQGHRVRVAGTASVSQFVGRATLEGLSGEPVFDDTFGQGQAMDHINWVQWADMIVVCPATSNVINKMTSGIADDALTTLWQAAWGRDLPLFVVPAMNTHMWDYPATRDSVQTLRDWGVHVLPTAQGMLACGEQGAGRMLEVDDILLQIDNLLAFDRQRPAGRILITGGGTREPIDQVRYIGNHSSGRTSAQLAQTLESLGYEVTWLGAMGAQRPVDISHYRNFDTFQDLDLALKQCLSMRAYDAVIHAAAVSDYSVRSPSVTGSGKLASGQALTLNLQPNPKLISRIKSYSEPAQPLLIGFKLTADADTAAVNSALQRQWEGSDVDYIVHNDMAQIRAGQHEFNVYQRQSEPPNTAVQTHSTAASLATGLAQLIRDVITEKEPSL